MRPLLIDEAARAEIARVVQYAEAHRIPIHEMQARVAIPDVSVGDDENFRCHIQVGFRCVLSVEQQPMGWCRHLSVSVDDVTKVPHMAAVKLLMQEFGMHKPLEECHVYLEQSTPKSVNVICPI